MFGVITTSSVGTGGAEEEARQCAEEREGSKDISVIFFPSLRDPLKHGGHKPLQCVESESRGFLSK